MVSVQRLAISSRFSYLKMPTDIFFHPGVSSTENHNVAETIPVKCSLLNVPQNAAFKINLTHKKDVRHLLFAGA